MINVFFEKVDILIDNQKITIIREVFPKKKKIIPFVDIDAINLTSINKTLNKHFHEKKRTYYNQHSDTILITRINHSDTQIGIGLPSNHLEYICSLLQQSKEQSIRFDQNLSAHLLE